MPGLLDFLTTQDPAKQQGLLGAAAALLQAGAPSKVPVSPLLGLVDAQQAYQQGVQGYQDRQQQQALYALKLQGLQGELADKERLRGRQERIDAGLLKLRTGMPRDSNASPDAGGSPESVGLTPFMQRMAELGDSAPPAGKYGAQAYYDAAVQAGLSNPSSNETLNKIVDRVNRLGETPSMAALALSGGMPKQSAGGNMSAPQSMASAMPGGPMSPKVGGPDWLQDYQQQNGLQLPTWPGLQPPTGAAPSTQMPNLPLSGGGRRGSLTQMYLQRLLAEADVYASEGDFEGADKRYQAAQKWMPQVDRIETAWKNGQPVRVITYKDGSEEESQYGAKPDMVELDLGGTKQFVDRSRLQPGQVFNKTMTFADRNAAARLRFDQQQAGGDDATSFTQQAIDNAAARYNVDGSLPPMGMGKAGAAGRTKILNRAAELKAGVDPTQQRFDQLNNRGDVQARNAAVRSFATGKDGQAVQSANTALNHLDTIQQLAQAQKSGDVRAFNQAARSLGAAFGQTAPTNLNAALIMVAPEISKAVVGAGGTGHERDQALQALNPNGSPDQIIGATQTMQELFGGRLTEAKRTYERTTKLNDFDSTMLSPAAQDVLARAQQHTNQAGGGAAPPAGGQFSVQAPNGKTFYFKTAKDLANFKLTAGIR